MWQAEYSKAPAEMLKTDATCRLLDARKNVGMTPSNQWSRAVRSRDPVSLLDSRAVVNRAFWKMKELYLLLDGPPPSTVYHLAEAPGGFAQCAKRLWPSARCVATSLEGDAAIAFDARVHHVVMNGLASNGDLLNSNAVDDILHRIGRHSGDLITADGGAEVSDLDFAEQECLPLALAQAACALKLQARGGSFILKIFEGSTKATRDILSIMRSVYAQAILYKPLTSKCANSERYIVCKGLTDETRADAASSFLMGTILHAQSNKSFIASLVPSTCPEVDAAFDALAVSQANSISTLLCAANSGNMATLNDLRSRDADWLCKNATVSLRSGGAVRR